MSDAVQDAAPKGLLAKVARDWTRIGITGFGGPPAHIALLRQLVVRRNRWMGAREFEDANAACGLLPGPASTQLAIFCAYRVAGPAGAIVGGLGFIAPAVFLILALSILFLAHSPPMWVRGAGAGAGAAVAAVAVHAARGLIGPSLARARSDRLRTARWIAYLTIGTAAAALLGQYLVLALLGSGVIELIVQRQPRHTSAGQHASIPRRPRAAGSCSTAASSAAARAGRSPCSSSARIQHWSPRCCSRPTGSPRANRKSPS